MGGEVNSSVNPGGPRLLTQRNLEKAVLDANGVKVPRPDVEPGNMQLFSYYKPGLTAGNYFISAEQFITAKNSRFDHGQQSLRVCNWKGKSRRLPDDQPPEPQQFEVMTPQFSLDEKLVNSFYPPEGHQDEGRVLPHIVMSDPHFPWERDAGHSFSGPRHGPLETARERDPDLNEEGDPIDAEGKKTTDREKMVYRSIVPWVKLLVFDPEELKIPTAQEAHDLGIPSYSDLTKAPPITSQAASGAFKMTSGEYLTSLKSGHRANFEKAYQNDKAGLGVLQTGRRSNEPCQVIFPTKDLVYKACHDIEANKYLAHVRNINTIGFPNAGLEENGLFSIVVSGRLGAFDITQPRTQICHLISLEHLDTTFAEDFKDWGTATEAQKLERFGLISLYSWTYSALPPDPITFIDAIKSIIGDGADIPGNMQMLRPPDSLLSNLSKTTDSPNAMDVARKKLAGRLQKGYTISRWRAETGELTAAFNRGPLVPMQTSAIPCADWPTGSNTSKSYQILDKSTGLMDLTYSHAWQLGKVLAIADTSFSGALLRFRSFIQRLSESKTLNQVNNVPPREEVVAGLAGSVSNMRSMLRDNVADPNRVVVPSNTLAPPLHDPAIAPVLNAHIQNSVRDAASAGNEIWNEFNTNAPNNTDWTVIHQWITDKLYLGDIPAHILFPDPSFIPEESLRFFYIDDAWLDCLIDGALSVGNHLEKDDDKVKASIKEWYNCYLQTTVPKTSIKPQVPCYGFILRSQIVKCMPDLKITVNWNTSGKDGEKRAPVCQWLRPDDHTLVCLLDRFPEELRGRIEGQEDLSGICLLQPPHQQRFSFGHALKKDKTGFQFILRELYTEGAPNIQWPEFHAENTAGDCLDMKTRFIKVTDLANQVHSSILKPETSKDHTERAYKDYVPNSAELGLELNDPAYYFSVYPAQTSTNTSPRNRRLWTKAVRDDIEIKHDDKIEVPTFSKPIGDPVPTPKPSSDQPSVPSPRPIPQDPPSRPPKVIFKDLPTTPVDTAKPPASSTPSPCFVLKVYVDYKGPQPLPEGRFFAASDYVPTKNNYLVDLIFSVRKDPRRTKGNTQLLREIVVNIPHSPNTTANNKTDALLKPDWSGGVRMLSNQRFTPFTNRSNTFLQVRLVPRSAQEHPVMRMDDRRTSEISFRLSDVDVPESVVKNFVSIKGKTGNEQLGFARVDMFERYQTSEQGVYSIWNQGSFVVKRDIGDEGH